jgi:hypothetical protein
LDILRRIASDGKRGSPILRTQPAGFITAPPQEPSMIKKILLAVAALIVIFVIVVALQPSDYRVSRTANIAAPAADVFAQVNDFHNWEAWSPWAKLDPNAKAIFEGPKAGQGAVFKWSGNSEVGEGSMTVTESTPAERIRIKLDFVKPMEGTSNVEFTFKPRGTGTDVTWTMFGQNNFIGKAMCLFMDQDKMLGGYFEKGLANLKSAVESAPKI